MAKAQGWFDLVTGVTGTATLGTASVGANATYNSPWVNIGANSYSSNLTINVAVGATSLAAGVKVQVQVANDYGTTTSTVTPAAPFTNPWNTGTGAASATFQQEFGPIDASLAAVRAQVTGDSSGAATISGSIGSCSAI